MRLLLSTVLAFLPAAQGWAAGERSVGGPKATATFIPTVTLPQLNGPVVNAGDFTAAALPRQNLSIAAMPGTVPALPVAAAAAAANGPQGKKPEAAASAQNPRPAGHPASQGNGVKGEGPDTNNGDGRSASRNSAERNSVDASRLFDGAGRTFSERAVHWLGYASGYRAIASIWRAPRMGAAVDRLLDSKLAAQKRVEAAQLLGKLKQRETIETLAAVALTEADAEVRDAAEQALAIVAGTWQRAIIRDATLSPRAGTRAAAVRALGAFVRVFDATEALEKLAIAAALDRDQDVRLTAIEALGEAKSSKALISLWRLRGMTDEPAQTSALEVAISRAEARLSRSSVPLAAYRPPEGDLGQAKQPLYTAALKKVIGVAGVFTAIELVGGFLTGSAALKADSLHLAADLAINAGALVAIWVARRPPNSRKTYGYLKLESIVGLGSAALIALMGLSTGYEAVHRLIEPHAVPALETMIFAVAGLLSNAISTWLLWRYKEDSLSLKGAFLHAATDALGSLGIIAGAGLIMAFGWLRADPVITLAIVGLILHTTWDLAKRSWSVLIDAVPEGVDLHELEKELGAIAGVVSVYDLHAWSLNSSERSATTVLFVAAVADRDAILAQAKKVLEAKGLAHSTVEIRPVPASQGGA